jgi:hypothetical protein
MKKQIISNSIREAMAEHHEKYTRHGLFYSPSSEMSFTNPVFRNGKPSRYLTIMVALGETGMTWDEALKQIGKSNWNAPGELCCIRHSLLRNGLIKAAGKSGRKTKWALTSLGVRFANAAMKHVHC